ncbi:MAG TPA: restriction endonuclease subunit S [Ramlibacter sp.]|uniref:restriction endonuclease subunit S n=1 Tax=Ramlibacter sp. TaxID=1917967 RepID=UPI002BC41A7D|nr:restriction endonuclease subunit S [Ramlibacter sp.]HVZ43275.1 restriction endonuclease subunit S [Ramlibacter sp.]
MRLATFFEKFDLFADAPDAVAKMRELILRMATSGRIAAQDPSDPPASELIDEIYAERDRLIARGVAKSRVEGSPIWAGDIVDIPASWARCMISEVCDLQTGATPSRQEQSYFGGNVPWVVSGDVNRGEITECDGRITEAGLENSNCKLVPPNSVLIALNGQGRTRATVAMLRISAALNQSLVAMIPYCEERLLPEYIFWNLRGRYYAIRDITGQDQRRGLNMKLVGQLSLPIPPLAEQQRIVAKVDELMALCDRLEAQQQERETRHAALARASLARFADAPTPANLELLFRKSYSIPPADLRKSILTLAVQGKLVPQDPSDEPAAKLLEIIGMQRDKLLGSNLLRKSKRCRQFTSDEAPYDVPATWTWTMLGEITDIGTGSTPSRTEASFWIDGTVPWITSGSTSRSRIVEGDEFVTPAAVKAHRLRVYPTGTLLVALYGQGKTRGQVALLDIPATINQACAAVCSLDGIPSMQGYLKLLLEKQYDEMRSLSAGGAQPNLNVQKIKEVFVPLPPLAEQRRIVAKVGELMALVDQLEKQQEAAKSRGAALLEAVIQELLNPTAKIILFPVLERDSLPDRTAIGCYAIQRLSDQRTFGRTAEVKVLYMAEAHLGLDLGGRYMRDAAGPLDKWIYKFEEEAAREQWFSVVEGATKEGHKKIEYRKGPNLSAKAQEAPSRLSAAQRSEFDRMLALLAQKPTVEVEIIATLFAAWNDFLIDGRQPNDDEIVREVRENWHPSKQRFSQAELRSWLAWLRQHALVPQGKGPHTLGQQGKLQLH